MIVLDASVLIGYLNSLDIHHQHARLLLHRAVSEGFGASAVTIAEALVGPTKAGSADYAESVLEDIQVAMLDISGEAAGQLAKIRADASLKLPDCCVLLAAEQHAAGIATFDERLAEAARRRGITVVTGSAERP